jgi:hypothetical protein
MVGCLGLICDKMSLTESSPTFVLASIQLALLLKSVTPDAVRCFLKVKGSAQRVTE